MVASQSHQWRSTQLLANERVEIVRRRLCARLRNFSRGKLLGAASMIPTQRSKSNHSALILDLLDGSRTNGMEVILPPNDPCDAYRIEQRPQMHHGAVPIAMAAYLFFDFSNRDP